MIGFEHPEWLWSLLLVPVVVIAFAIDGQVRRRQIERLGHLPQIERMTATVSVARRRWKRILDVLALTALLLALAEPTTPGSARLAPRRGLDIVVALDFSRSMLAPDIYPTRLDRAKRELNQLLDGLRGDRVGLVAFAGVSLEYPLTNDYEAAKLFWRDLGPDDLPVGGTNLAGALRDSLDLLERAKQARGRRKPPAQVIVLLTDGADTEGGSLEVAREAARRGVRIYAVGIGTGAGEFVPIKKRDDGSVEYLEDNGQPVRMRLDADTLKQMATITQGDYFQADPERFGVDRVQRAIAALERTEDEGRLVTDPESAGAWFFVAALVLLLVEGLIGERRFPRRAPTTSAAPPRPRSGGNVALLAILALAAPHLVGFDFFDRPQPDVEQGNKRLSSGDAKGALEAYDRALAARPDDPVVRFDRAAALAALGKLAEARADLERAAESGDPSLKADALYNLGNGYLAENRAKEAAEAYKRSLLLRPDDRHAKWNLELALRRLAEEKQKQKQKQNGDDKQQGDKQQAKSDEQKQQEQKQQQQQTKSDEQKQQQKQQQAKSGGQKQDEQQKRAQAQNGETQHPDEKRSDSQQAKAEPPGEGQKAPQGQAADKPEGGERDDKTDDKRGQGGDVARGRDSDRQNADAILDAFERVEPTVQKDLARRRAAGVRKPRRDW